MKPGRRQKTCLFCGNLLKPKGSGSNAKTDEHVPPKWLQKHLRITSDPVTPMRVRTVDRRIIDARRHVLGAFKAGTICYDCNHGWMARLEDDAKPILIPLIADPQQLAPLQEQERFTIARWTLKTAAALNRCSTHGDPANANSRTVPDEHMRTLASGRIPNEVLVLGAGYRSMKAFDFLQYAVWTAPKNSAPLLPEDLERSYKIALSFRDLVLMVAYYPAPDFRYGVNEKHYVPLQAGNRSVVLINHLMDDSAPKSFSPQLECLLRNIFVASETWLRLVENVAMIRLLVSPV